MGTQYRIVNDLTIVGGKLGISWWLLCIIDWSWLLFRLMSASFPPWNKHSRSVEKHWKGWHYWESWQHRRRSFQPVTPALSQNSAFLCRQTPYRTGIELSPSTGQHLVPFQCQSVPSTHTHKHTISTSLRLFLRQTTSAQWKTMLSWYFSACGWLPVRSP